MSAEIFVCRPMIPDQGGSFYEDIGLPPVYCIAIGSYFC